MDNSWYVTSDGNYRHWRTCVVLHRLEICHHSSERVLPLADWEVKDSKTGANALVFRKKYNVYNER